MIMGNSIASRDVHIAVLVEGQDQPQLYRRRNPQAVAWERYAHKQGYDLTKAGILALTYQAWVAARPGVPFDDWQLTLDDVYPASPDGERLEVDKETGRLVTPDGEDVDEMPHPTQAAESAT